jgi:hypothetical protein
VYAVNYNVLRVMSGMGGLAYSNWADGIVFYHLLLYIKNYLNKIILY